MEGTVKWFDGKKGYGFIVSSDGQEYFVHFTAVPKGLRLRENDKVSFDAADTERGKQAQNVQLLEKGQAPERKPMRQSSEEDTEEEAY
ncbi:cold shock domain-containing protein [Candidatus Woesearchaeota archaeon]|nr:cold shock domain-containing protein [Candidatus Woesearchaeota archaeon]